MKRGRCAYKWRRVDSAVAPEDCWKCWEIEFARYTGLGATWLLGKGIFTTREGLARHIARHCPTVA